MSEKLTACPHCGANLVGDEIPEKYREHFGGATHGSRLIAHVDPIRDRCIEWECPDCHARWSS